MDLALFERKSEFEWHIKPFGNMHVPGVIFASEALLREMDAKVYEQVTNVAMLPGIVEASWAMPDAHWGYGFPIGGVAAFDADAGGVVSAGGVGFDIFCGVRTLHTGLNIADIDKVKARLADALYHTIPAGMGSTGAIRLDALEMDAMLRGYGTADDLERIEEGGCMHGADPSQVSEQAKKRQRDEMGTLGSGNHYLEIQQVTDVYAPQIASVFGVKVGDIVVSIHCGSRGLGHQIGTEFLKRMVIAAGRAMSRHQALRNWNGRHVVDDLEGHGILIRSPSMRGVAEEAPGAYKDVSAVVEAADQAGLARKVARLVPLICIKG